MQVGVSVLSDVAFSDIEAILAKEIARGDVDPVTLLPMEDINPNYIPRAVKVPLTLNITKHSGRSQDHGKRTDKSCNTGILSFFCVFIFRSRLAAADLDAVVAPRPRPKSPKCSPQPIQRNIQVGRASGKRTLVDVMEQDLATKKRKGEDLNVETSIRSRFFGDVTLCKNSPTRRSRSCDDSQPIAGPSFEKENIPFRPEYDLDISMEAALEVEDPPDPVTQEDGYLSPPPPCPGWDTPALSSPLQPVKRSSWHNTTSRSVQDDFGVDHISSPPVMRKPHQRSGARRPRSVSPTPTPTTTWTGSVESPDRTPKVLVRCH